MDIIQFYKIKRIINFSNSIQKINKTLNRYMKKKIRTSIPYYLHFVCLSSDAFAYLEYDEEIFEIYFSIYSAKNPSEPTKIDFTWDIFKEISDKIEEITSSRLSGISLTIFTKFNFEKYL